MSTVTALVCVVDFVAVCAASCAWLAASPAAAAALFVCAAAYLAAAA